VKFSPRNVLSFRARRRWRLVESSPSTRPLFFLMDQEKDDFTSLV
jgi:hypothetical protein